MREMLKMIFVLSLICGLSGLTLATVRDATSAKIEEQVLTYVQGPALKQVFTDFDNNPVKDRKTFELANESVTVFPAMKEGKLTGVAFERYGTGYGGPVGVMVGINTTGTQIAGIGITTSKETPGLGARASEPEYREQFRNQPSDGIDLTKNGGPIQAIAGATTTSTATVNAVNDAVKIFMQIKDKFPESWGS
ncbi:RnfABCDGE type electron transport complex subunit G [Pseudodesulfovibrio piezophilus]|uniref:Ion-translocating oxidoreductase complex subunit G n=1 Tax=Pseudodesulfovibrio piezophilus (strain DSM 21447 / JCM 15486 / C1TLV30) TaxID=1322246 RepID=M1WN81_PSEP2|nr:RnfABCDGE type electron transport complex subunit G [Pseudodesulfovibrio piezophilus]CCH47394.1 Electron transport complex, RnfABCDGE type, G subunit [Pseudodesulfovibrio piezophilus C1TLV30]